MAIVVENGSIVANANSYVTRADFITYAADRGVTIANTAASDVYLIKAAQYINDHEDNLKGTKTDRDQPMAFPRSGLEIEGWYWTNEEIPRQVILCQYAYALDVAAGIDLWNRPKNPGLTPKTQTVVGAVSVTYAIGDGGQKLSRTSTADALLASLLKRNGLQSVAMVRA